MNEDVTPEEFSALVEEVWQESIFVAMLKFAKNVPYE